MFNFNFKSEAYWVKGIISNVKSDLLDDEQKKRLKAFKIGKVRMIWLLYKLNK